MEKEIVNLIVWGAGQEYIRNKHLIKHLEYKLVDASKEKQGKILDGVLVETPDILFKNQYDYIVISSVSYREEIFDRLVTQYSVPSRKIICSFDVEKEILLRNIGEYKAIKTSGPRIMFGYCFLQYENCRIHDYLLAESLRIRGAEIVPVICGGIQELDCSGYGGVWGNNTHDAKEKEVKHYNNCLKCLKYDKQTWSEWGNFPIISANDNVTNDEKIFTRKFIQDLDIHAISSWMFKYFPIGEWALKRYFNKELISFKEDWNSIEEAEIRSLAYNVMIMCIASLKIVDDVKPEIIYSNDSFYYPYSILEKIAKNENIPFYNAYGFRKGTYSYALNTSTLSMDLDSAWSTFSKRELNDVEENFIDKYIDNRRYGTDMMINTADPFKSAKKINSNSVYGEIDSKKNTALLATNVTWDASALNKEIIFKNIVDWVLYTVELFSKNVKWQLIVKGHPAEVNKAVPEAHERICSIVLNKYNNSLPPNIILIDGDAPVSVYDLLEDVDLGIVYTTTVGLEMCCRGIPTITVAKAPYRGKGFSYDPVNLEEYIEQLSVLMNTKLSEKELKKMMKQAKKFFLLYYFIYMFPNSFYSFSYRESAQLKIKNAEELMPGKDALWDYICDSILEKKAILSADRFPPYELRI